MNLNQFNPGPEEVEKIKKANKLLPQNERICYKCGHKVCSHCGNWCDVMLSNTNTQGNWKGLEKDDVEKDGNVFPPHPCCEGKCSY